MGAVEIVTEWVSTARWHIEQAAGRHGWEWGRCGTRALSSYMAGTIWPAQDYQSRKYKSYRVNGCHRKLLDWSCLDLVEGLLFWFLLSDLAATWSRTSFFNYERNELSGIVLVHERSIRQAVTLGSKMGWPQLRVNWAVAVCCNTGQPIPSADPNKRDEGEKK